MSLEYYICDPYPARLSAAALTEFKIAADFAVMPMVECLTYIPRWTRI